VVHPLKNILNRLRWDSRENPDDYMITYRHRGAPGDVRQIRASSIKDIGKSYFTIQEERGEEETIVPFHRILEIQNTHTHSAIWVSRRLRT
jgi:hypothetical protein